jgi:tight adherence protein C
MSPGLAVLGTAVGPGRVVGSVGVVGAVATAFAVAAVVAAAVARRRRLVVRHRCHELVAAGPIPRADPSDAAAPFPLDRSEQRGAPVHGLAGLARRRRQVEIAVGGPARRLAGRPGDDVRDARVGRALVVAVVVLVCGTGPVVAAAGALATWATPVAIAARARSRRREAVADETPEVVELIRLAIGSGLNVRLALDAVTRHHDGVIADEVRQALGRVERGERLADALDSMVLDSDAVRPLVDALVATERDGAPLVDPLDRVATDARTASRRRAEEAARRVPVKLLFPLVFCTLPAFVLLTVVPVLLRSLPSFAP